MGKENSSCWPGLLGGPTYNKSPKRSPRPRHDDTCRRHSQLPLWLSNVCASQSSTWRKHNRRISTAFKPRQIAVVQADPHLLFRNTRIYKRGSSLARSSTTFHWPLFASLTHTSLCALLERESLTERERDSERGRERERDHRYVFFSMESCLNYGSSLYSCFWCLRF